MWGFLPGNGVSSGSSRRHPTRHRSKGFSLIELLIAVSA
ncbi:MAG: prepilin-type N-terminal cleavage/methylation domain-containing protein [Pseudomonas sp.]